MKLTRDQEKLWLEEFSEAVKSLDYERADELIDQVKEEQIYYYVEVFSEPISRLKKNPVLDEDVLKKLDKLENEYLPLYWKNVY